MNRVEDSGAVQVLLRKAEIVDAVASEVDDLEWWDEAMRRMPVEDVDVDAEERILTVAEMVKKLGLVCSSH